MISNEVLDTKNIVKSKTIKKMARNSTKISDSIELLILVNNIIKDLKEKKLSVLEEKRLYKLKMMKINLKKYLSTEMWKYFHFPFQWVDDNTPEKFITEISVVMYGNAA